MTTGLDRTYHADGLFLVSHFNFLFVPCVGLTCSGYQSAFYCTLNTHYRIVSYSVNVAYPRAMAVCCARYGDEPTSQRHRHWLVSDDASVAAVRHLHRRAADTHRRLIRTIPRSTRRTVS